MPRELIVQALDDNRDGQIDAEIEAAWHAAVDCEIDGMLGQRYPVPFTDPLPAVVSSAGLILRCEALYQRRGIPPDQNPFSARSAAIRKKLDAIGKGVDPLTPEIVKSRPVGTVISEPSRLVRTRPGDGTEASCPPSLLN